MGGFNMAGPCYQFRVARTRRDTAAAGICASAAGTPAGQMEAAATMTGGRGAFR